MHLDRDIMTRFAAVPAYGVEIARHPAQANAHWQAYWRTILTPKTLRTQLWSAFHIFMPEQQSLIGVGQSSYGHQ